MLKLFNTPSPSISASRWTNNPLIRRYLTGLHPSISNNAITNNRTTNVSATTATTQRRFVHNGGSKLLQQRPSISGTNTGIWSTTIPSALLNHNSSPTNAQQQRRTVVIVTETSSSDLNKPPTPKIKLKPKKRKPRVFVPPKAAVKLTPKARQYCRDLLDAAHNPEITGIMLRFQQSRSGEPRMVFSFEFVKVGELGKDDEGVSLEVLEDGTTPIPPMQSMSDGKRKLYLHQSAILKVLGGTLDVEQVDDGTDTDTMVITPVLYDREGNLMDPNA
mmetsp:Transcript_29111/g.34608  ORF Transcript_29111/g.34608 Transcript_29111/m.34608 type:complete len:275 (-) Transcript_29111:279-1103(-)